MLALIRRFDRILGYVPESLVLLFVRIVGGHIFFASARTRIEEGTWFTLADSQVALFDLEYKMPFPELVAPLTATMEHVLPILLFVGLFSRFAALGLAVMTLVIQSIYPEEFWVHSVWFALFLVIVVRGPGKLALDRWMMGSSASGSA